MKRKLPSLDAPHRKHRILTEDEQEAWREAMDENKPKPRAKPRPKKAVVAEPSPPPARRKPPLAPAATLEAPLRSKVVRGTFKPQVTLDLHGYTQDAAWKALIAHSERWQESGITLALVITGKGKGGGVGVLKSQLPRWIAESPLRERIIAYDKAHPRHGGEGAWYIRIRKRSTCP